MDSRRITKSDLAAARRLGKLYGDQLDKIFAAVESGVPERHVMEKKRLIEEFRGMTPEAREAFITERQISHDEEQARRREKQAAKKAAHKEEYQTMRRDLASFGLAPAFVHEHAEEPVNGDWQKSLRQTTCHLYKLSRRRKAVGQPLISVSVPTRSRCGGRLAAMKKALNTLNELGAMFRVVAAAAA